METVIERMDSRVWSGGLWCPNRTDRKKKEYKKNETIWGGKKKEKTERKAASEKEKGKNLIRIYAS